MAAKEYVQLSRVTDVRIESGVLCKLFNPVVGEHFDNGTDLLAVATKFGTRIIGHPTSPELQILYFKDEANMPRSRFLLRGIPKILSLNCTENILAVNYNANGIAFVDLFSVKSFLSSEDLQLMNSFRFDCMARQILWNPIESSMFAICLDNGSLDICMFNGKGGFAFRRVARETVRCVCWNSEEKQIVYASTDGVLKQCDLDRGLIKTIDAPQGLLGQPYEPIALKWLSSHQFAIIFLENSNDARPKFFIVNTHGEKPTYLRFDGIYYSPQISQVYLLHLSKWNVILTGSRNDTQINVLAADASTETLTWTQIHFADEKRAQLPLKTADCGPFSILGITLENQTSNFMKGNLLIAMILTCGRLVTVKLMLSITAPALLNENASGIGYLAHRFEMPSEVRASIDDLFKANDFSTFRKLLSSPNLLIYDRDRVGAILSIATMRELISAAARKFHSAIRNALEANPYPLMSGNSDEWLSYLLLLESTAEITEEEMRRTKHALHSIISILSKAKAESPEKPDLSCDESHHEEGPSNSSVEPNLEIEHTETEQPALANTEASLASSRQKRSATMKTKIPSKNDPTPFSYACHYCKKRYKQERNLRKHEAKDHECELMALKARGDKADPPIGIVLAISEAEAVVHETHVASENIVESKKRLKKKETLRKIGAPSPFVCNICNQRFARKYAVKRHIASVHNNKKVKQVSKGSHLGKVPQSQRCLNTHPFLCDICNNQYSTKRLLKQHILGVHVLKLSKLKTVKAYRENVPNGDRPTTSGTVKQDRRGSPKRKAQQKTAVSHPFLCNICGDRYKHVGRLAEHSHRDHTATICAPACEIQQTSSLYKCKSPGDLRSK